MTPYHPSTFSAALVTGANGFVGHVLCQTLAHTGWHVVSVSRKPAYDSGIAAVHDVCLSLDSGKAEWQRSLASVQCVVHLAAQVHQLRAARNNREDFYRVNVDGTRFVAEQAALAKVRRFVFVSSIKVNGEGLSDRPYNADDAPNPVDAYGQSKLDAENALRNVCVNSGMELIIIRPPLVYGPEVRANFERLLRLAALGLPLPLQKIHNRRSLVSVWNLVDFIETTMRHPKACGTWLVSDGEDLSTPDLVAKLNHLMGKHPKLFGMSPVCLKRVAAIIGLRSEADRLCDSLQVDISPARNKLNWRPPISVNEGLARTVAGYLAKRKV